MAEATKKCPRCKEEIDKSATKCKHCGADLRSWFARHPILTVLLLIIFFPPMIGAALRQGNAPAPAPQAPPPTAEEIAKQKAEQEAFDKTPAGKLCLAHPTWSKDDCQGVADKKIWIGMTLEMLETEVGKPDHDNISNYGSGVKHQYCWTDKTPSCFYDNNGDGVIDAYN